VAHNPKQMNTAGVLPLGKSYTQRTRTTLVDRNTQHVIANSPRCADCKLVSTSPGMSQRESLCCVIHFSLLDHIRRLLTNDNLGVVAVQETPWKSLSRRQIPRILWITKINYPVQNRPPHVPILCQSNPLHILITHYFSFSLYGWNPFVCTDQELTSEIIVTDNLDGGSANLKASACKRQEAQKIRT